MSERTKSVRAVYRVTFYLEVALTDEEAQRHKTGLDEGNELIVEEAVTALVDEELSGHREGQTRCGVPFSDAHGFTANFVEVRQ